MFDFYSYVVLPLLIFCARVTDVSIGTIRIIRPISHNGRHGPFFIILSGRAVVSSHLRRQSR